MKKAKTILFIGNNYCSTIGDVRSTFESNNKSNYIGKEGKPLRKELLAYFKDGLLSSWLLQHGYGKIAKLLPVWKLHDEISDNELFKAIYKAIFGQECTADLEAAFSSIAELVYCEVDGTIHTIRNNKIELSEKANEIKFVYKALEEIDSKICFELTKPESSSESWTINSKMDSYSKGGEFSISFSLDNIGKNREGKYAWKFVSDHKEGLYNMEIHGNQRKITLNNGEQMTLYRFNDEDHDFWVTEPKVYKDISYNATLKYFNKKDSSFKFKWATKGEIKAVLEQGANIFGTAFPVYTKDKKNKYPYFDESFSFECVRFISISSKTNDNKMRFSYTDTTRIFYFVAVLDETTK